MDLDMSDPRYVAAFDADAEALTKTIKTELVRLMRDYPDAMVHPDLVTMAIWEEAWDGALEDLQYIQR